MSPVESASDATHVLIVDRAPALRRAMQRRCLEAGLAPDHVFEAATAADALAFLERVWIDVILVHPTRRSAIDAAFVTAVRALGLRRTPEIAVIRDVGDDDVVASFTELGVARQLPHLFESEDVRRLLGEIRRRSA